MKATGIVRKIDELGRVVIPKELRMTFGITEKDPLEIFTNENMIILRKYAPGCVVCGSLDVAGYVSGKELCHSCVDGATKLSVN